MAKDIEETFHSIQGLDKESASHLIKALEANNKEGFDYLEFKLGYEKLIESSIEKDKAISSTLILASTMGVSKEDILHSAQGYLSVLEKESSQFAEAVENQVKKRVKKREKQITELKAKISEIDHQIKLLQNSKQEMHKMIEKAAEELEQSETKISRAKENFDNAYQAISDEIAKDIDKIKRTLKN